MSDEEDYDRANDDPIEAARDARVPVVLFPEHNELFIDIDTPEDLAVFWKQITIFARRETFTVDIRPSRRRDGRHILVRLGRSLVSEEERLMLQAMLGSDRARELLCLHRIRSPHDRVTCFFENGEPEEHCAPPADWNGMETFQPAVKTWREHFGV